MCSQEENNKNLKDLSVVIPTYKARNCLLVLHQRLTTVLEQMRVCYEILFVEDHGNDGSWELIEQLALKDSHVYGYRLKRNYGQATAIAFGLSSAKGRWILVMDDDLQDPPESIPLFYEKALSGYQLVVGWRQKRSQTIFRQIASRILVRLIRSRDDRGNLVRFGTFSLLSQEIAQKYLASAASGQLYLSVLENLELAENQRTSVEYLQAPRYAGKSSYSLFKLGLLASKIFLYRLGDKSRNNSIEHDIHYSSMAFEKTGKPEKLAEKLN